MVVNNIALRNNKSPRHILYWHSIVLYKGQNSHKTIKREWTFGSYSHDRFVLPKHKSINGTSDGCPLVKHAHLQQCINQYLCGRHAAVYSKTKK
jgi:hypothetical protein